MSETLLIGGDSRWPADYASIDQLDRVTARYAEVVLQVPVSLLPDAWRTLRQIRGLLSPKGILTVFGVHADGILRLAGLSIIATKRRGDMTVFRARLRALEARDLSCTVVVPCKNEVENVGPLISRVPRMGISTEILFVDGNSTDGTQERIRELMKGHTPLPVRLARQAAGRGKASAVFEGFRLAEGDVVMILDADMTVAPEDLPRFFLAISEGATQFANGTRFAHPMEVGAMPAANAAGNRIFSRFVSTLTGIHLTDTLCGTKALLRSDWQRIAEVRDRFGNHDPWGDFDLLFGAAYVGLDILDVPVPYYARVAGESKMRPIQHGLTLLRTCARGGWELAARRAGVALRTS